MTGYFIRMEINGRFTNVEIDQLSDEKLAEWVGMITGDSAKEWLVSLCKWIRENVQEQKT